MKDLPYTDEGSRIDSSYSADVKSLSKVISEKR